MRTLTGLTLVALTGFALAAYGRPIPAGPDDPGILPLMIAGLIGLLILRRRMAG